MSVCQATTREMDSVYNVVKTVYLVFAEIILDVWVVQ